MPPDDILGPPLPWFPNSLSSLDSAWTPRRNGPTHLAVSSGLSKCHPGKSVLSQVPSHWTEGELDPLPETSKGCSTGQGILQEGGNENCYNFSVNVCVCEFV
jgi:hypothetical protein